MPLWCNVSVRRKRCSLVWIFYCVCCFKKIHTRDMTSVIHTYFILAWEDVFYWALETGRSQSWNSSFRVERFKLSHVTYSFYEKVKLGKHKELFPLFYFCPLTLTCSNVSPGPFVLKCPVCRVRVGPSRRRGIALQKRIRLATAKNRR